MILGPTIATTSSVDTLPFSFYALKAKEIAPSQHEKLAALLKSLAPALSPKHIPELLFLKEKLKPYNGCAQYLQAMLDILLKELERKKAQSPEDDLVEHLSRLSLQCCANDDEKLEQDTQIIDMLIRYFRHQKDRTAELSTLAMISAPLIQLSATTTPWTIFAKVLRVSELFFSPKDKANKEHEILLKKDLEAHEIETDALFRDYEKQRDVAYLQPISPFLRMIALFLKQDVSDSLELLVSKLQAVLWRDLLSGQTSNYMLDILHESHGSHRVHIVPLNLAVMMNDMFLASSIIACAHQINQRDAHGYTPAHFAALFGNALALVLFKRLGADFTLRSALGATVYDILKSKGYRKPQSASHVTLMPGQSLPLAAFEAIYKKKYTLSSVCTLDALFRLWLQKASHTDTASLNPLEKHVLNQFLKKPYNPPLYLHKNESNWQLLAKDEIQAGDFLIALTGTITTIDELDTPILPDTRIFQLPNGLCVSFSTLGSTAEYIAQGPPVCSFMTAIIDGEQCVLVYALRKIAKDERITMNFGREHYNLSHTHFVETNTASVEHFIKESKGLTYFPFKVSQSNSSWNLEATSVHKNTISPGTVPLNDFSEANLRLSHIQAQYTRNMMEYLFEFPEYPLQMIEQGKMPPGKFYNFLEALRASRALTPQDDEYYRGLVAKIIQIGYRQKKP